VLEEVNVGVCDGGNDGVKVIDGITAVGKCVLEGVGVMVAVLDEVLVGVFDGVNVGTEAVIVGEFVFVGVRVPVGVKVDVAVWVSVRVTETGLLKSSN